MVSSGASEDHDLTPLVVPTSSVSIPTPAAEYGSQALLLTQDVKWIAAVAFGYALLVLASVFTLHPYFAQTWDVVTFVNAGKSMLSPDWAMLYALSRADRFWPYAYPPLHALVVAPLVALAGIVPGWLMVRIPPLLFDVGVGGLLYAVVGRKTQDRQLARLALLVWLLNPVTWYDTAVQGHFEAEWLFFVVLGYLLYETKKGWLPATLALSVAFLFKQNAVLFALPLWVHMFVSSDEKSLLRRASPVVASAVVYALPIVFVSLPFLLASNDYWYMNVQYVADVPLQTQSWLVALANWLGADNLLLRASSVITFVAAVLVSLLGARRRMGLWLTALLIVLAFFLVSKKVVGYYYVMVLPFAIVTLAPAKQYRMLALIVLAGAFISLAPYFASWANQAHGAIYGVLGILNSALWLGIGVWLWRKHPLVNGSGQNARLPVFLSVALFLSAGFAALLQPFIASEASPIRAPLVATGSEAHALIVFLGFAALVAAALLAASLIARGVARDGRIAPAAIALVILLAPMYFLTFTLTKESTAALEYALAQLGL